MSIDILYKVHNNWIFFNIVKYAETWGINEKFKELAIFSNGQESDKWDLRIRGNKVFTYRRVNKMTTIKPVWSLTYPGLTSRLTSRVIEYKNKFKPSK